MSDSRDKNEFLLDEELLIDFLVESRENINQLDLKFAELRLNPDNFELLTSIFRVMHTLKGNAGLFKFKTLSDIAHFAEDILSKLRDGIISVNDELINALLEGVNHIKILLKNVEIQQNEGNEDHHDIMLKLKAIIDPVIEQENQKKKKDKVYSSIAPEEVKIEDESETKLKNKDESWDKDINWVETDIQQDPASENTEIITSSTWTEPNIKNVDDLNLKNYGKDSKIPKQSIGHDLNMESNIKVDANLLDDIKKLVEKLIVTKDKFIQTIKLVDNNELQNISEELTSITDKLHEKILRTRLQPVGDIFNKFLKLSKELAKTAGKEINVELGGTKIEIDKTILESVKAPLIHIIRNSIDHGIESPKDRIEKGKPEYGTLIMRAFYQSNQVILEISDDGEGINPERIKEKAIEDEIISSEESKNLSNEDILSLLFKPGFTTSEKVTDISGRGVGLDVVKTNIERLGGKVELFSQINKGTRIRIIIPYDTEKLKIYNANKYKEIMLLSNTVKKGVQDLLLFINSQKQEIAVPILFINRIEIIKTSDIRFIDGKEVVNIEGNYIKILKIEDQTKYLADQKLNEMYLIVIKTENDLSGILANEIIGLTSEEAIHADNSPDGKEIYGTVNIHNKNVPVLNIPVIVKKNDNVLIKNDRDIINKIEKHKNINILLLQDFNLVPEENQSFFESEGYMVFNAENGEDGFNKILSAVFDLFVIDLEKPNPKRLELIKKIRSNEKVKQLPIIILASPINEEERNQCLEAGATAYMLRSDKEKILKTINNIIYN